MPVRLFVGGLSFTTSTDGLRGAFARFGAVESAMVMMDRETGRSRGFGFVEMATTEEAERAMSALNGSNLDGRMIRVDKATPRGEGGGRPRPGGPRPGGWSPRPGGGEPRAPSFGDPYRGGGGGGGERPSGGGPGGDRPGGDRPGGWGNRQPGGSGPPRRRGQGPPRRGEGPEQARRGRRPGGPSDPKRGAGGGRGRPSSGADSGYRWGR